MKLSEGYSSAYRNSDKCAFLFLLPSFIGVAIFVMIPFADVIKRSFFTAVSGEFKGVGNYREIFDNQAFQKAVINTLRFTFICLPVLITSALFVALLLWKSSIKQQVKSALLIPMAVPAAAVVLVWKILFSQYGIFNMLLTKTGRSPLDFMGSDLSFWVLAASYIWKNLGYTVVLFLTGLSAIQPEMLEAGKMDGAGGRKLLTCLILPHLKPMLYTITVLSFLNSFKVFREAYLVAGAYPQDKMYLLQHLFNNWFMSLEMDKIAAAAVCTSVVLFGGTLFLQKLWDREGDYI